jgi:hypothetical protein
MNPRIGSGMQQARDLRAEEAVEVVQNHEDGTRFFEAGASETEAMGNRRGSGRSEGCRWRGTRHRDAGGASHIAADADESQERRPTSGQGQRE